MNPAAPSVLDGGGTVAALLRSGSGAAAEFGPPERWPLALRSAMDLMLSSRIAMFVAWGPDLRLVYNDACAEILGQKHPAALGAPFRQVWGEVWNEVAPLAATTLAGEAIYREDLPLRMNRRGFDESAWFTFSYSPIRDEMARVGGLFCVIAETTSQVRARRSQAFRLRLEERLRELSEPATIMATAAEVLGRELAVARVGYGEVDAAEGMLVVEADWTDGRLSSLIGKHRMEGFGRELATMLKTGGTLAVPDIPTDPRMSAAASAFAAIGTRSTLAVSLVKASRFTALLYLHDPQPRPWDETEQQLARDVAERTWAVVERARAELRLRDREERLRELNETLERRFADTLAERKLLADIVEGTDVFVQVCDLNYDWLAINRASAEEFARMFRVERPKAGDNMLRSLAGQPESRAAVQAVWARALAGEEFIEIGRLGVGPDPRHYEMRFRALRDESGRVVGAYQFMNDVTARLREQARLRDAEAALTQAQKMEAIGQLTGGIAHDFNNLLSAIVGNFELIKARAGDDSWVRRFAQAGLQVAERGARLTGQLLAFSRSQRIELRALNVAELIGDMRDLLARTLGPMIRLRLELATGDRAVMSDATQLEMAVLNLAINARDAMPGGGTLTIGSALHRLEAAGGLAAGTYVEISVADTGVGMTAEVLAHAFDPFFTTKDVGQGTGLGLSQVYAIARQGGGTARIDSEPGRGTTVRLLLPATGRPRPRVESASAAPLPALTHPRAKVLLIDDDRDIREVVKALLEGLGYEVRAAEDGASGLALLETFEPQLLLLDFAMPGMNGAQVARSVRARWPSLPIVFASGYADTAALAEVPGPACAMLRKPFAVDELQRVLAEVLG